MLSLYGKVRLGAPDFGGGQEGKLAVDRVRGSGEGLDFGGRRRGCPGPKGDSASLAVVGSLTLQRTVKVVQHSVGPPLRASH